VLEASFPTAAGRATHRSTISKPHRAHGHGVQNCLWGAPRIHGELLKLGFAVSERTVSRYLPDRLTRRSQTWRTFLANYIGSLALSSTATSSFTTSDDGVDACVLPCRPVPSSRAGQYASI
jgi:hypothetical protein